MPVLAVKGRASRVKVILTSLTVPASVAQGGVIRASAVLRRMAVGIYLGGRARKTRRGSHLVMLPQLSSGLSQRYSEFWEDCGLAVWLIFSATLLRSQGSPLQGHQGAKRWCELFVCKDPPEAHRKPQGRIPIQLYLLYHL